MSNLIEEYQNPRFICPDCGKKMPIYRNELYYENSYGWRWQYLATQCVDCTRKALSVYEAHGIVSQAEPFLPGIRVTEAEEVPTEPRKYGFTGFAFNKDEEFRPSL